MDIFPTKAQFLRGEEVFLQIETGETACSQITVEVTRLEKTVVRKELRDICGTAVISLGSLDTPFSGYGVDAVAFTAEGAQNFSTAFDVAEDPRRSLRYGFLSDFTSRDQNNGAIDWLTKCHINMLQFYDWSYRHDDLVAREDLYRDMMGKNIAKTTVLGKIREGHARGMHAVGYGAIYAASKPFYEAHKEWAFYNSHQDPFVFIDVFYIMNIQKGSPWCDHIIGQYGKAMEEMGFDGIHMDTYGFPKTAYSHLGAAPERVRLDEAIPALIDTTRKKLNEQGKDPLLVFNNVGNWPTYSTANASHDAVYIEVWSPYEKYAHIAQLIGEARRLSAGSKPIILAAYLKPFREVPCHEAMASAKLLTAAIVSHGAYHLLLGENRAVLTQGYYSDYSKLDGSCAEQIRKYYDFMIRYLELFYDPEMRDVSMTHTGWDNYEYRCLSHETSSYGQAGKLWTILREKENRKSISILNLCGCTNDDWNEVKEQPIPQKNVRFRVQVDTDARGVFAASPENPCAEELPFTVMTDDKGCFVEFEVPEVSVWTTVWIDFREGA